MSLESRRPGGRKLSAREHRTLAAFKAAARRQSNPAFAEEMARRIDDKNPANWATIEDLDKRFGFTR